MTTTTTLSRTRLAITMAFVATLAACGGGSGGASSPTSSPSPAPSPAPAPAPSPSTGDLSTTIQPTTYTAGGREAAAYAALNAVRQFGGFGTVAQNSSLDQEATNQAAFVANNYTIASGFGGLDWNATALASLQADGQETGHVQLSTLPGYTAYSATDRATYFGYPSGALVAETASFFTAATSADNGNTCVSDLLASPSHRELLLDPRFRDVGIGYSTLAQPFDSGNPTLFSQSCYVATAAKSTTYSSTGEATASTAWVGTFPASGSTVSTSDGHGHGYAPSVTVDSQMVLTVSSFTITDASGNAVPTTLNADALTTSGYSNWAFATPNAALAPNTTYTVSFSGSAGGAVITKTWSFTTGSN
jgi:uncharacterized protein YkwD